MRSTIRRRCGSALDFALLFVLAAFCAVFVVWPIGSFVWQALPFSGSAPNMLEVLAQNSGAILNSVFVAVLVSLLSCAIALAVALVVTFGRRGWASLVTGLVTLSLASPPFVASLAYIELFGRRGLVTHGLLGLSVSPYGWQGIVFMEALFFTGINVILLDSVLERVDKSAVSAALDLGAPMRRVFADIILPLLRPGVAVCLLLTFVRSIADYATPVIIGGKFETISTQIYVRVVGYSDLGAAAVLNLVLFAASFVAFIAYRRLGSTLDVASKSLGASVRPADDEAGFRLRGALGVFAHVVTAAFSSAIVAVYATIVHAAFTKGMGWSAPLTLDNLTHLMEYNVDAIGRSILYALLSAGASTLIGLLAAYFVHRRRVAGSFLLDFLTSLPYTIPGICLGLGYILAFNRPPLELVGTSTIIVAVLTAKEIAISTRAFTAALAQVPPELDMAAKDLGAPNTSVLWGVLAPNLRSAFGVSLINGFTGSMMAYAAVLFLIVPGHKTAIFELFDALSGGKYGEAAMISLALVAITSLVCAAFGRLLVKRRS